MDKFEEWCEENDAVDNFWDKINDTKNWFWVRFIDEDVKRNSNILYREYVGTIKETATHIEVDNTFKIHSIDKKDIIEVRKWGE